MIALTHAVESSVRVYQALIRAYPASFRREYGNEMALVFREHLADVFRERGTIGLAFAWFRVLGDLARTAPQEHLFEMQRRLEMKKAAIAILSAVLAAIVFFGVLYGALFITMAPFLMDFNHATMEFIMLSIFYLAAFLTGIILTRVKSSIQPIAAVRRATIAILVITAFLTVFAEGHSWEIAWWGELTCRLGFVASLGLAAWAGCLFAARTSSRLARFSVRWFQLVGPLAVLVCTSFVAIVLRLALLSDQLASEDLRRALAFCLFALFLIAVATIAGIVLLFVRSYQVSPAPQIGLAEPRQGPVAQP